MSTTHTDRQIHIGDDYDSIGARIYVMGDKPDHVIIDLHDIHGWHQASLILWSSGHHQVILGVEDAEPVKHLIPFAKNLHIRELAGFPRAIDAIEGDLHAGVQRIQSDRAGIEIGGGNDPYVAVFFDGRELGRVTVSSGPSVGESTLTVS